MGSVECSHGGEFTGCRLALLATSKPLAMFEKTQVMNTILVTGGAGFIGSCFVRGLLAKEQFRVINFDWLTYAGNLDSVPVADGYRHIFVRGNICDSKCVTEALEQYRPSQVVHFAAESHVDRSIDGPAAFVQTNVVGTACLLDAALTYWKSLPVAQREAFRFLHVSTDEVYGSLGQTGLFTELTPYAPNSPYSATKASADHLVRAWHHTFGLPTLITNCSNNYGPYQFPEKLIPLMTLNAIEGKPLPIYGDGLNVRDWLYVEDHCAAISTVLARAESAKRITLVATASAQILTLCEQSAKPSMTCYLS